MYLLINDKTLVNLDLYDLIQKGERCITFRQGITADGTILSMKVVSTSQESVDEIFQLITEGIENELPLIRCVIPEVREEEYRDVPPHMVN